jgi:hypothetical protein
MPTRSRHPVLDGWWTGWFGQAGTKTAMGCHIALAGNRLSGFGADSVGVFAIVGLMSVVDRRVAWTKSYVGRHAIRYTGVIKSTETLEGLWFLGPGEMGSWELRFREAAVWQQPASASISDGLTGWLKGDFESARDCFSKAARLESRAEVNLASAALSEYLGETSSAEEQLSVAREHAQRSSSRDLESVRLAIDALNRRVVRRGTSQAFARAEDDDREHQPPRTEDDFL